MENFTVAIWANSIVWVISYDVEDGEIVDGSAFVKPDCEVELWLPQSHIDSFCKKHFTKIRSGG